MQNITSVDDGPNVVIAKRISPRPSRSIYERTFPVRRCNVKREQQDGGSVEGNVLIEKRNKN